MNIGTLKLELMRDEGVRLKPYEDTVGKLTIGIGRNLDDVGITTEEAEYLLLSDIKRTAEALNNALPWWVSLDETRQRVMLNMAFNMGIRSLLGFKNTLAAIQAGRYDEAATGMLSSRWATQVGDRAVRLSEMMKNGDKHGT